MNARRILLWVLPFLCGGVLIFFAVIPPVIQKREQAFEAMRQEGWTADLQDFSSGIGFGGTGIRSGDMLLDGSGRIWLAGGSRGLQGVHAFDGTGWISHAGDFTDIAISPQGEVWTLENIGYPWAMHVYDGQQWKEYPISDLGLGEYENITQVEIDSRGRVWAAVEAKQVVEIIQQEGRLTTRVSDLDIDDCYIVSLDADNQGRIWAAVNGESTTDCGGLYVSEGDSWQRLPEQGMNLQQVVGTAFDDKGRTWAATQCGDVLMYDGKDWAAIVQGESDPKNCCCSPQSLDGITLDRQGRVWAWSDDRVQLLEEGKWITLTEANSAIPAHSIFGVAVDGQDQVWIASTDGVQMAAAQDARPLPEKIVREHQRLLFLEEWMGVTNLFLPVVLAMLWLAAYLNVLPGVLLALVIGLLTIIPFGPPDASYHPGTFRPNLVVFVTLAGMIGGLLGGWLDRNRLNQGGSKSHLNYILAIIGLVGGFVLGLCYFVGTLP